VRAKAALTVVVLAVHVARDHAAECDELGARRYRREPAARQERAVQLGQRDARLGVQHARLLVKAQDAVGEASIDHLVRRRGGQGRIAVGSSEPATESRAPRERQQVFPEHFATVLGHAPPTHQLWNLRVG
jgi:hypothetical protein